MDENVWKAEVQRLQRELATAKEMLAAGDVFLGEARRERDEARAVAAQLRQDVEALAAADVELRRKIADLRHIANVNGDWTVKVSELVAALNTASALLVEAQAERDGAMDTITTRTWERDEARSLLRECRDEFTRLGRGFPDLLARLDAALGEEVRGE